MFDGICVYGFVDRRVVFQVLTGYVFCIPWWRNEIDAKGISFNFMWDRILPP